MRFWRLLDVSTPSLTGGMMFRRQSNNETHSPCVWGSKRPRPAANCGDRPASLPVISPAARLAGLPLRQRGSTKGFNELRSVTPNLPLSTWFLTPERAKRPPQVTPGNQGTHPARGSKKGRLEALQGR
jgi:hypothetical protein